MPDIARRASQVEGRTFPYTASRVCYFERYADGTLRGLSYKGEFQEAVRRARLDDGSTIFAVWPAEYESYLFLIDDLDALAAARKL